MRRIIGRVVILRGVMIGVRVRRGRRGRRVIMQVRGILVILRGRRWWGAFFDGEFDSDFALWTTGGANQLEVAD